MANISLIFLLILYTNVYNIVAERNVASGKQTAQSSTDYGGVASRAVDGNTDADYYKGSCSHTAFGHINWWCVDLKDNIDIERVQIYNPKFNLTQFQYRFKSFEIKLGSSGSCNIPGFDSATSCYKNPNTIQAEYTVEECNQGNQGTTSFTGRFLFISVVHKTILDAALVMCEVEILEKCSINCNNGKCDTSGVCNGCIGGKYGNQCDQQCNTWCNGGCNQVNGICNGCIDGRYGEYCNKTCSGCLSNGSLSTCDRNGGCHHGCIDGKSGSTCDKMCKQYCTVCQNNDINSCLTCTDGRFGVTCDELCNENCQNIMCNRITGSCSEGCVAGKTGTTCTQECHDGWYGANCSITCGNCADNIRCDKATGSCGLVGCQDGYTGPKCQTEGTGISSISPLVAGLVGALSATSCSLLICFIYYRRKLITRKSSTRTNTGCVDRIDETEDHQNISPEATINLPTHPTHPTLQSETNEYETLEQQVPSQYEVLG